VDIAGQVGRYLMGTAITALGAQSLLLGIYVGRLQPIPDSVPGHAAIAYLTGLFLVVVGLCVLTGKWAREAAAALAAVLLAWVLVLYVPQIVAQPFGSAWNGTFETFALFSAAWLLAALLPVRGARRKWDGIVDRGLPLGRLGFGISLPVFGTAHFVYHDFVASWVPKWIPAPQFWAYFTGAAHCAAGVSIVVNVLARVAALLAGIMYGSWALLVHIPRIAAAPHDAFEWNGLFVASALCAGALLVAGSVGRSTS
jgi:uncharacterized membrane protein